MNNSLSLTDFIRHLKGKPLGYSSLYIVQEGREYAATVRGLTATANREGVKISTSKALIIDPDFYTTTPAIKVTAK